MLRGHASSSSSALSNATSDTLGAGSASLHPRAGGKEQPVSLARIVVPLVLLAMGLASVGKLPAFVVLSVPLVTMSAVFMEGADASFNDMGDAFISGAFLAPPLLLVVEFVMALALAVALFGMEDTFDFLLSMDSKKSGSSHLADHLLVALNEQDFKFVYLTCFSFFIAGLAEEVAKLCISATLCKNKQASLLSSRRLLWTCGAVGLGLAFGESAVAVVSQSGDGARSALERVFTSHISHVACAVLAGARLASGKCAVSALAPSFAAHGFFDLLIILLALLAAPKWVSLLVSFMAALAVSHLAKTAVFALIEKEQISALQSNRV